VLSYNFWADFVHIAPLVGGCVLCAATSIGTDFYLGTNHHNIYIYIYNIFDPYSEFLLHYLLLHIWTPGSTLSRAMSMSSTMHGRSTTNEQAFMDAYKDNLARSPSKPPSPLSTSSSSSSPANSSPTSSAPSSTPSSPDLHHMSVKDTLSEPLPFYLDYFQDEAPEEAAKSFISYPPSPPPSPPRSRTSSPANVSHRITFSSREKTLEEATNDTDPSPPPSQSISEPLQFPTSEG
jgi:hypothetical protein